MEDVEKMAQTAVERLFCVEMEKLRCHPMDEDHSKMLITLLFASRSPMKPEMEAIVKEIEEKSLAFKIIKSRLLGLGYEPDVTLLMFMSTMVDNPGSAVMYAHYLAYKGKKHSVRKIDIQFMCERVFPIGFPTDEDMSKVWDMQKVSKAEKEVQEFLGAGIDNLLDRAIANRSILWEDGAGDKPSE